MRVHLSIAIGTYDKILLFFLGKGCISSTELHVEMNYMINYRTENSFHIGSCPNAKRLNACTTIVWNWIISCFPVECRSWEYEWNVKCERSYIGYGDLSTKYKCTYSHTYQQRFSINVWVGIIRGHLLWTYLLPLKLPEFTIFIFSSHFPLHWIEFIQLIESCSHCIEFTIFISSHLPLKLLNLPPARTH